MDPRDEGEEPDPDTTPAFRWQWFRVRRHVHWARTQGLGRLIEEDQLDPFERFSLAARKAWWRRRHDHRPNAVPVFLVGAQRSGTNMLARGFERSPEFEVHNENDGDAFVRFRLRPDPVIRDIVQRSRHAFVLFKPLCDSHRVGELLDGLGTPSHGRGIWAYRGFEGRVRSSVAKFGDANLRALRRIATGQVDGLWQAGGLNDERLAFLRSFDYATMTPATASALFWYVRNSLYFDLGLVARDDVILASYGAMVADPERTMLALAEFLGVVYTPELTAHVERRPPPRAAGNEIDPKVRSLCQELEAKLDAFAGPREGGGGR
jgi:hypothetical protein